jgi:serine/threonine protein kinase
MLFALKAFKDIGSRTKADFRHELEMLSTVGEYPHDHITQLLASWTQDNKFYMLFPCGRTNLGTFLRDFQKPELTAENVLWLLSQLKGLADGLRQIHLFGPTELAPEGLTADVRRKSKRKRGFHHDLKPQNILVFADDNDKDRVPSLTEFVLTISDFGAAKIKLIISHSQSGIEDSYKQIEFVRGDPVYSAPDHILEQKTSRPYDIWSLGCVFLEILLWVFNHGNIDPSVFEFERKESHNSQSTKFWHKEPEGRVILKSAVVERLKMLQDLCRGRGIFEHLVRLTARMLTIAPQDRPQAQDICNDLDSLRLQADFDLKQSDFYLHDIPTHVEIAAPPTPTGQRRPSIDERLFYANEGGLMPVNTNDFHLSPLTTQETQPGSSRSRSPTISISDHDTQTSAAIIMAAQDVEGEIDES